MLASNVAVCLHEHYKQFLSAHGDTARDADWPDEAGRLTRFDVGLDIVQQAAAGKRVVLCDLGCGTGELYRRIRDRAFGNIVYVGLDQSPAAIAMARAKFPEARFEVADVGSPGDRRMSIATSCSPMACSP